MHDVLHRYCRETHPLLRISFHNLGHKVQVRNAALLTVGSVVWVHSFVLLDTGKVARFNAASSRVGCYDLCERRLEQS
jgi:hypothetical protein